MRLRSSAVRRPAQRRSRPAGGSARTWCCWTRCCPTSTAWRSAAACGKRPHGRVPIVFLTARTRRGDARARSGAPAPTTTSSSRSARGAGAAHPRRVAAGDAGGIDAAAAVGPHARSVPRPERLRRDSPRAQRVARCLEVSRGILHNCEEALTAAERTQLYERLSLCAHNLGDEKALQNWRELARSA